jgi:uncharacterized membrane protein
MRKLRPESFVAIALLVFGLIACLATPLSAGYDEETHFIRAWEMAHLYFVPNEKLGAQLPFPALYWDLSYRREPLVQAVEPGFWAKYGSLGMEARDYVYANVETRSVYSPVLLLPQSIVLRYLGLKLHASALEVYYASRIAGLLCYLLLAWLAVRLIPFGKWLLAVLILAPMAVFQAATISADTISNGIGFFFVGATLALAQRRGVAWKQWLYLLGLLALLFTGKVNLIFLALLPFLLIRPSRYSMRYGFALLAAAGVALFLVEVGGWNVVAYSRFTRALEGANPREQLLFILSNPLLFTQIIARDLWTNTPAYMQGWIGVYGYNYWPVPALTYVVYPVAVLLGLPRVNQAALPSRATRVVLGALFILGYVLSLIAMYVAFTPARSLLVAGVQGRYFTVIMPLLFLAVYGLVPRVRRIGQPGSGMGAAASDSAETSASWPSWLTAASAGLASFALLLFTAGLILSYHVPCGSQYYESSLCYQPQYKNWAPESVSSPPVSRSLTLIQEIVPACDRMTDLRVWVHSRGTDSDGTTTLLLRAPTQEKDVVRQTFRNADVRESDWLTIRFPAEVNSSGQLYILTITGSADGGVRLGYSEKPEYLSGRLMENGSPLAEDILFQYGCVAGLQSLASLMP